MRMTWGRWRTRTAAAGLIGGAAYLLILLVGDVWAAEIASHDPPCDESAWCFWPPSFFEVLTLQGSSFLLGLTAIVAVLEFSDRRVVRTPRGPERVLYAFAIAVLCLPALVALAVTSRWAVVVALVLAGPPAVLTCAYLVGPPPVPASFAVRHPFLARVHTPPVQTRVVRAGWSLRNLFEPYPADEPPPSLPDFRQDLFTTTPDEDEEP